MTKNKLEKKFSESAKESDFWCMKLHNNMLAHQTTPADYILSYTTYRLDTSTDLTADPYANKLWLYLVECKQVTCKDNKGRLAFKRLKQMHSLLNFEKQSHFHKSFFCIAFYDGRWDNSDVYIIPAKDMDSLIHNHKNVSMNRESAREILKHDRIEMKGKFLDLKLLLA